MSTSLRVVGRFPSPTAVEGRTPFLVSPAQMLDLISAFEAVVTSLETGAGRWRFDCRKGFYAHQIPRHLVELCDPRTAPWCGRASARKMHENVAPRPSARRRWRVPRGAGAADQDRAGRQAPTP